MAEKISKETIYNNLLNDFKIKFSELTNINPSELEIREGDIIKAILESISDELYLRYLEILNFYNSFSIYNISGENLDNRAFDYNLTRNPATFAYGYGVFNINPPAVSDYTINLTNTTVSNSDGTKTYTFVAESVFIPSGSSQTPNLLIKSSYPGLIYNEEINNINVIQKLDIDPSDLSGSVITFVNTTAIVGGSDKEEDEVFRQRILTKLAGTSIGTYSSILNEVNKYKFSNNRTVLLANIKERFLDEYTKLYIYTDNPAPSGSIKDFSKTDIITNDYLLSYKINYVPIYTNSVSITLYEDYTDPNSPAIQLVKYVSGSNWDFICNEATGEIVFNGGNNRSNLPTPGLMSGNKIVITGKYYADEYNELQLYLNDDSRRVIGSNLKVLPANIYTIPNIVVKVKLLPGIDIDTIKPDVKRGIDRYINILKPGDDFIISRLIDFIYEESGEKIVDLRIETPASNIPVNEDEKIIYSNLSVQLL